jgi:hypothetical protein
MMRKFADLILRKCLNRELINSAILQSIDLQTVRKFFGEDFLSPIQKFALDGYNSLLYQNLNVDKDGVVVVLGGYLGDSANNYSEILGCVVNVYEPIEEFYRVLESRFSGNDNVNVFNYAISSSDRRIQLSIDGEKTGFFNDSNATVEVEAKDICGIIDNLQTVDLLESIRASGMKCKFYQASTSELYGSTTPTARKFNQFPERIRFYGQHQCA